MKGGSELPLAISMDSARPLYEQLESQLRQLILADVLPAGTVLPSVRALGTQVGCSVITTRRVYQDLEQEGLIVTLQGRGTMVADVSASHREHQRLEPIRAALRQAVRSARATAVDEAELRQIFDDVLAEEEEDA